jgi:sec-independent protein translocase protein TatA
MAIMGIPGGLEWWIILAVILLLFGPTQLPKLAKMIGKSAKTLKEGLDGKLADDEDEAKSAKSDDVAAAAPADKPADKPEDKKGDSGDA